MKRGHCTGYKKERPMTAKEQRDLETLSAAIWAVIEAEQAVETLADTLVDAITVVAKEAR